MTGSAKQLRRDAATRLGEIAGYDHRLDIDLTLARPNALQVLIRQALGKATGDELLLEEVRMLAPVVGGKAWALDDAIHEHGLPERTPDRDAPAPISVDQLQDILEQEFLGGAR